MKLEEGKVYKDGTGSLFRVESVSDTGRFDARCIELSDDPRSNKLNCLYEYKEDGSLWNSLSSGTSYDLVSVVGNQSPSPSVTLDHKLAMCLQLAWKKIAMPDVPADAVFLRMLAHECVSIMDSNTAQEIEAKLK